MNSFIIINNWTKEQRFILLLLLLCELNVVTNTVSLFILEWKKMHFYLESKQLFIVLLVLLLRKENKERFYK